MIKNFENWLNESSGISFEIALDMVIYKCLGSFSKDGGNDFDKLLQQHIWNKFSKYGEDIPEGIFGADGPDLWVNCGDFNGEIPKELDMVSRAYKADSSGWPHNPSSSSKIQDKFAEYGMKIQTLHSDEVIVEIILPPYTGRIPEFRFKDEDYREATIAALLNFYTKIQPEGLKELSQKLRIPIAGNRYGV
jgi:hypothetical protein